MLQKNISVLIGLLLILAACQAPQSKQYPYLIKLSSPNCPDYKQAPITLWMRDAGITIIDTARVEKDQVVFRGTVAHPGVYSVHCQCPARKTTSVVDVYLPADSVQVAIGLGQNLLPAIYQNPGLGAYDIGAYLRDTRLFSTAPQQREVAAYLQTRDSLWNKFFLDKAAMAARMNAAIAAGNKPEIDRWGDSTRLVQENFPAYLAAASALYIKRHPKSAVDLFALLDAGDTRIARQRLRPYYQAMPAAWRESYFGRVAGQRFK